MTFTEIVAEVIRITKRQDKIADARREINAALSHFVTDSQFARDRYEQTLSINAGEYTQSIALASLPRYRKMWYMKQAGTRNFLTRMEPSDLFKKGCDLRNKWYVVGESINISMSTAASALDIGYYRYPQTLTDSSGSHWMTEAAPHMLIDRAASKIFTNIGDDASAARHEAFAVAAYTSLVRDSAMGE